LRLPDAVWHSGNAMADNAKAPSKLLLIDFEAVVPSAGEKAASWKATENQLLKM